MKNMDMDKVSLQIKFGQVLRRERLNAGFSQEKLALECGLDRTYISLLERGLRTPTLYTIFLIASQLGITTTTLVTDVVKDL